MPTVLLTIESRDQSSAVLQRVQEALAQVDRQMQAQGVSATQVIQSWNAANSAADRYAASQTRLASALSAYDAASRRALAADQQRQSLAASLGTSTDAYATAATRAAAATDRQAQAGLRLADAYRAQAAAGDRAAAANAALTRSAAVPMAPTPNAGETGKRTGILGLAGGATAGIAGAATYMAAYAAYSQLQQAINKAAQESISGASMAATTGLTSTQAAGVDQALHQMIQQRQTYLPFTSLQQGVYPAASVMPARPESGAATLAVGTHAINLATAFNSPDVTSQATALIAPMVAMGLTPGQMVTQAPHFASMEYQIGKLGLANPSQLAGPLSALSPWVAQGVNMGALGGLLAYGTSIGLTPDVSGQDTGSLLANLQNPDAKRRQNFKDLGIPIGQNALDDPVAALQRLSVAYKALGRDAGTVFGRMFDENTLKLLQPIMRNPGAALSNISQVKWAFGQTKLDSDAAAAVMHSPGAQFVSAEQQFEDSLQRLGTSVLPGVTAAIDTLNRIAQPFIKALAGNPGAGSGGATGGGAGGAAGSGGGPGGPLGALMNVFGKIREWNDAEERFWLGLVTDTGGTSGTMPKDMRQALALLPASQRGSLFGSFPALGAAYDQATARAPTSAAARPPMVDPLRGLIGTAPGLTGVPQIGSTAGTTVGTGTGDISQTTIDRVIARNKAGTKQQPQTDQAKALSVLEDSLKLAEQEKNQPQAVRLLNQAQAYLKANAQTIYPGVADAATKAQITANDLATQMQNAFKVKTATATGAASPFGPNVGMGGLDAGFGNTVARFGGVDPQTLEIRHLQQELAVANSRIEHLLEQIAANTKSRPGQTAKLSVLDGTGTNRGHRRG